MKPSNNLVITILVDDFEVPGLVAEHGLSFLIELDGGRILFDTGQGPALEANSRTLGVDLATIDTLILSHGHYDHTGGIPHLIEVAKSMNIYAHPGTMQKRFNIRDGVAKPVQIPRRSRIAIERFPTSRLFWVSRPHSLSERLGLTGPIPRKTSFEDTGGPFFLDKAAQHPDLIEDDLALWIKTGEGLVICVGCCHSGLINTLDCIRSLTGESRIRAIIGGLHLIHAGENRLDQTLSELRRFAPQAIIPCHCTGELAVSFLGKALGASLTPGVAGTTYRF